MNHAESAPAAGRYDAQTINARWGEAAQTALTDATVFVVGAGALGAVTGAYLAGAGVGRLAIVDGSTVAESDLHRQVMYLSPEAGMSKADSLAAKLSLLNPDVHVDPFPAMLSGENASFILMGADLVLDCSSSDAVRLLVNDARVADGAPFSTVATSGFDAALLTVKPGETACCRCHATPVGLGLPAREEAGVFGPPAGAAASMMALSAIGLITGVLDPRAGELMSLSGDALEWRAESLERTTNCICADGSRGGNV